MTPEQLGRLFQAFTQADASTTRKYGGTGLGLTISRHFCQMMGGDISVTSEYGRGSTFTIRLPARVAEARPVAAAAAKEEEGTVAGAAGVVLVIDDDPAARELMQRFLSKEGYRVICAAGGEEGLKLARKMRPDAITLDVMMPGLDGWAVLSNLKADPTLADIPVVMITMVDDRNMGYALGATEYMVKPVDRERLLAVLHRHLREAGSRPVLVVEDDPMARDMMQQMLQREGWRVLTAENGRAGLEQLAQCRPELVLLDLMMPEMDGFAFIDALRGRPEWREIPVVVVTAKDLTAEERERLNGSVQRILQKGAYSREALMREVISLMAGSVAAHSHA